MKVDVIIVGSGVAGTLLAFRLLDKGLKPLIISDPSKKQASLLAAGLINPIVFRTITMGWRTTQCLKEANSFYTSLEEKLSSKFYHPCDILRLHGSIEEREIWEDKKHDPDFASFLGEGVNPENYSWLKSNHGISKLKGAAFVNSQNFIDASQKYFEENRLIAYETFNFDEFSATSHQVVYKNIQASKIIFCDGAYAEKAGFFQKLHFNPAKGEVLTIKTEAAPEEVFNGKVYGVPVGNGYFKVGSTYTWDEENDLPTEGGKAEILEKLEAILNIPFEVVNHEAGFRPTIRDRRPYLGFHPEHTSIGIFNGLGTKGYLMAPWLSELMTKHIVDGEELPREVRISRISKKITL